MNLSEEQVREMLSDTHCQAFIEAMAGILVHQSDQAIRLEEETEETPASEDDHL